MKPTKVLECFFKGSKRDRKRALDTYNVCLGIRKDAFRELTSILNLERDVNFWFNGPVGIATYSFTNEQLADAVLERPYRHFHRDYVVFGRYEAKRLVALEIKRYRQLASQEDEVSNEHLALLALREARNELALTGVSPCCVYNQTTIHSHWSREIHEDTIYHLDEVVKVTGDHEAAGLRDRIKTQLRDDERQFFVLRNFVRNYPAKGESTDAYYAAKNEILESLK